MHKLKIILVAVERVLGSWLGASKFRLKYPNQLFKNMKINNIKKIVVNIVGKIEKKKIAKISDVLGILTTGQIIEVLKKNRLDFKGKPEYLTKIKSNIARKISGFPIFLCWKCDVMGHKVHNCEDLLKDVVLGNPTGKPALPYNHPQELINTIVTGPRNGIRRFDLNTGMEVVPQPWYRRAVESTRPSNTFDPATHTASTSEAQNSTQSWSISGAEIESRVQAFIADTSHDLGTFLSAAYAYIDGVSTAIGIISAVFIYVVLSKNPGLHIVAREISAHPHMFFYGRVGRPLPVSGRSSWELGDFYDSFEQRLASGVHWDTARSTPARMHWPISHPGRTYDYIVRFDMATGQPIGASTLSGQPLNVTDSFLPRLNIHRTPSIGGAGETYTLDYSGPEPRWIVSVDTSSMSQHTFRGNNASLPSSPILMKSGVFKKGWAVIKKLIKLGVFKKK